jgi:hypothetical protein
MFGSQNNLTLKVLRRKSGAIPKPTRRTTVNGRDASVPEPPNNIERGSIRHECRLIPGVGRARESEFFLILIWSTAEPERPMIVTHGPDDQQGNILESSGEFKNSIR